MAITGAIGAGSQAFGTGLSSANQSRQLDLQSQQLGLNQKKQAFDQNLKIKEDWNAGFDKAVGDVTKTAASMWKSIDDERLRIETIEDPAIKSKAQIQNAAKAKLAMQGIDAMFKPLAETASNAYASQYTPQDRSAQILALGPQIYGGMDSVGQAQIEQAKLQAEEETKNLAKETTEESYMRERDTLMASDAYKRGDPIAVKKVREYDNLINRAQLNRESKEKIAKIDSSKPIPIKLPSVKDMRLESESAISDIKITVGGKKFTGDTEITNAEAMRQRFHSEAISLVTAYARKGVPFSYGDALDQISELLVKPEYFDESGMIDIDITWDEAKARDGFSALTELKANPSHETFARLASGERASSKDLSELPDGAIRGYSTDPSDGVRKTAWFDKDKNFIRWIE